MEVEQQNERTIRYKCFFYVSHYMILEIIEEKGARAHGATLCAQ
jgi:hypothetical protein